MSKPKYVVEAEQKLGAAIHALRDVHKAWGRGAGGREMSLSVTNAEQSLLWFREADRVSAEEAESRKQRAAEDEE